MLEIKEKQKIRRKIPSLIIGNYLFKMLLFDKSILILSILTNIISVIWSIVFVLLGETNEQILINFNYYFLINACVLNFVLSMRICQFFWNLKIDDKTFYLNITQQVSRRKLYFMVVIVSTTVVFITYLINSLLVFSFYSLLSVSINYFLNKLLILFLIYSVITALFLIIFLSLMLTVLKPQIAVIACSFILASFFVISLPQQFQSQGEKQKRLEFTNLSSYTVPEVYKIIDLQEMIQNGDIKYPNLSKYINTYFIDNEFAREEFSNSRNIEIRKDIWSNLGIISNKTKSIELENQVISNKPTGWVNWQKGHRVNLKFTLDFNFISIEELETLASLENNPNHLVLIELLDFVKDLNFEYLNDEFYLKYLDLYADFISLKTQTAAPEKTPKELLTYTIEKAKNAVQLENVTPESVEILNLEISVAEEILNSEQSSDENYTFATTKLQTAIDAFNLTNNIIPEVEIAENTILNLDKNLTLNLESSDISAMYKNYYSNTYPGFALEKSSTLTSAIQKLNDPLMLAIRVLENYFINYTSKYISIMNYKVTNSSWEEYISSRKMFNLINIFNITAGTMQSFTYFAEKSYEDIWFAKEATSSITLDGQNNLFLPYVTYTLELDENGIIMATSNKNYFNPIWFIVFQIVIAIFNLTLGTTIFNKRDFK